MLKAFTRLAIMFTATALAYGQTQTNPATQIAWPLITGSGTPTSLNLPCTSEVGLTVNVTAVSGVVTVATINTGGSGIVVVPQTVGVLGGGGSGAVLTITAASGGVATAVSVVTGGSGYSTASGLRTSLANYGQPYQDTSVTPNKTYTCGTDGWAVRGGTLTSVTASAPLTATPSGGVVNIAATGASGTYSLSGVINVSDGVVQSVGPAFSASLACASNITCGNLEAGVTTTSPAGFTASYANPSVPTSATISDGVNSAVACTSSFTACSLPHQYCTVADGLKTWTFTLTAVGNSQTQTPSVTTTCTFRTFVGPGTGGATGATASGTNAVLAGATGTLASAGLTNQGSYACTTTSAQYCYILMQGGSHTFTSGGFTFPMNAPTSVTFTNQFGVATPLYLYQSSGTVVNTTAVITVAS